MNCELLAWVARQDDLDLNLQGFLLRLARLADGEGRVALTQKEIAPLVGLKERQTRALLSQAASSGAIARQRRGGAGGGRVCDVLAFNLARNATGTIASLAEQPAADANDQVAPVATLRTEATGTKQQPATGTASPLATASGATSPVSNNPRACIEHASARAEPPTNITTTSELYPETDEPSSTVCGKSADVMPIGGGMLDANWLLSPDERAFANERGYLNGSCDELFGQFLDHCATKGPRMSASWRSEWRKWVRNQVRFDTQNGRRQTPHEASHVSAPSTSSDPLVRRERVSPTTAARMRRRAERASAGEPLDFGRVESQRIT